MIYYRNNNIVKIVKPIQFSRWSNMLPVKPIGPVSHADTGGSPGKESAMFALKLVDTCSLTD